MKKLIFNLVIVFTTTFAYSQKSFDIALQNIADVNASLDQYRTFKDSIKYTNDSDDFFTLYYIDLTSGTVTTSVDEGSILQLYKIISKTKSNGKIELTITSNNETSFVSFVTKNRKIVELVHYSVRYDRISGIASNNIGYLK